MVNGIEYAQGLAVSTADNSKMMNFTTMATAVLNTYTFITASLTLMFLLVGCASKSVNSSDPTLASFTQPRQTAGSQSDVGPLSLIARDFAHILPQISVLSPEKIALSVIPDDDGNTEFAEAMLKALFQQGYAVRIGGGNFSSTELRYQILESDLQASELLENGPAQAVKLFQLDIGDISLRRRYGKRSGGQVQPVSAMEGRGLDPTMLDADESIFNVGDNNLVANNTTQTIQATGNITPVTDFSRPGMLPKLTDPLPGTQLSGSDVTFMWDDNGIELDQWFLRIGLSEGAADFAEVRLTDPATIEYQVSGLPTNGVPVFVELSFRNKGVWTVRNFEYTAFDNNTVSSDDFVLNDDYVTGAAGNQPVTAEVATNDTMLTDSTQQNRVLNGEGLSGNAIATADAGIVEDDAGEVVDLAAHSGTASQNAASSVISPSFAMDETSHLKDLELSSYLELVRDTVVIDILVVEFENNSSTILPDALARLNKMAANLVNSDDLISVIGTSHGRAPYPGAHEDLARGRAIAVRNSLLAMGVESDKVYLGTSWSHSYHAEVLQSGAAVIEVRRLAASTANN